MQLFAALRVRYKLARQGALPYSRKITHTLCPNLSDFDLPLHWLSLNRPIFADSRRCIVRSSEHRSKHLWIAVLPRNSEALGHDELAPAAGMGVGQDRRFTLRV